MKHTLNFLMLTLLLVILMAGVAKADSRRKPMVPEAILLKADLDNGKSIYNNGKPLKGTYLTFQGGPHWLRSKGGGCKICHGSRGWGDIEPEFCFILTPPITYKYLAGDGYPAKAREDGSHPIYTELTLQRLLETGYKPNGVEVDYCMPRWRISEKAFTDLLGYIISLDDK